MRVNFLLLLSLLLTACTSQEVDDPHAEFNRDMLELNLAIDENVLCPVATAYRDVTPHDFRESVSSFLSNIKEPYYMLNYVVSFDAEHTANSLFRFFINSILGFLGFFDVAAEIGLEKSETSYKDTLHTICVPTGDYLILPIFGSSSTNYAIAEPISWFCDPFTYVLGLPCSIVKFVVHAVSDRAEKKQENSVTDLIKGSMDLYSVTKSMYFQKYGTKQDVPKKKNDNSAAGYANIPTQFADSPTPDE
ncbi:MAG: VacJ family lipoprotein [Holosporaceae bacterium]|jgi:phospholipid-binding lipoprotein MlaA|nr:VacJ family lipoprotein [Holosporaceae bacterium]